MPVPFLPWLRSIRRSHNSGKAMDVPCGGCNACCRSALFIHVSPDEKASLARIPKKYLVPAPGLPKGHLVMGHLDNGHCPMLKDGACSIYEDRPRACRAFDCRVFAAAGLRAGGRDKAPLNRAIRLWEFSFPRGEGRGEFARLRAAASIQTVLSGFRHGGRDA